MPLPLVIFSFLIGLSIGSFVNVVIYRTWNQLSPLKGRSFCDHCKRQLSWHENIPVFSFLFLRGKCKTCHKKIDWTYPAVELLTGLLFLWWATLGFAFFKLSLYPLQLIQPGFWLIVGVLLLIVFMADLIHGIIPDFASLALTILTISYRVYLVTQGAMQPSDLLISIFVATGGFLLFLTLHLATKGRGMGFGDVKFAFPMGLLLGFPRGIVGYFASFMVGGILGVFLLLFGKKRFGQTIPFGPFLVIGTLISLTYGQQIWQWYMGFF